MSKKNLRIIRDVIIWGLFFLIMVPSNAISQSKPAADWVLRKDQNGIRVYTRKSETSSIDDLKIISTLHGSLSSISALIIDANNFPNWIYSCKEGRIVAQISPTEQYQYQRLNAPYPVSDRDVAIHFTIRQDPATKIVYTRSVAVSNYLPPVKDVVRLPVFDGGYELQSVGNGNVLVTYTLKMDPGGSIPDWIVNMTIVTGPYESTIKMQKQVELSQYANAKLPFILEP